MKFYLYEAEYDHPRHWLIQTRTENSQGFTIAILIRTEFTLCLISSSSIMYALCIMNLARLSFSVTVVRICIYKYRLNYKHMYILSNN